MVVHETLDVVVIGAGPAGLAAGTALLQSGCSFAVFEAGKKVHERSRDSMRSLVKGVGGAGLYSDGKFSFYPSATKLWQLEDKDSLTEAYDWLSRSMIAQGHEAPKAPNLHQALASSEPAKSDFEIDKSYPSIYINFDKRRNFIESMSEQLGDSLRSASRVLAIHEESQGFLLHIETISGVTVVFAENVIFAGGRFGAVTLRQMMPHLPTKFRRYEIGVRIEQPSHEFIFQSHTSVDVKKIVVEENSEWRTFCTCRNGEVVETDWDGVRSYSGCADKIPTDVSNIGVNLRLSAPPSDEEMLSEIHEIIMGNIDSFNVEADDFFDADRNFFGRHLDGKFREYVSTLLSEETLANAKIYGPCIEGTGYYPDINNALKINSHNIWIAGDATGIFRGLTAALISGYFVAKRVTKKLRATQKRSSLLKQSPVNPMPVIFTAQSKVFFYCRDAVCEYVLKQGLLPLNPFRVFEYFLGDRVDRDTVRQGNNQLIAVADELWVFGPIADGVLFEIVRARRLHKPVRFFSVATRSEEIREIRVDEIKFEPEVHSRRVSKKELLSLLTDELSMDLEESDQLELSWEEVSVET